MELDVRTTLGGNSHSDLFLKIPLLGVEVAADTYWLAVALENRKVPFDDTDVRRAVINLLIYWAEKTSTCEDNQTIHLPFDFADQSIGCLQVEAQGKDVRLAYGFSRIEGWAVNPLSPGTFFQQVNDFKPRPRKKIELSRQDFLHAIESAIAALEREGASFQR